MGMPSAMAAWPITNPGTSAAMERRMLNCAYSR
jgi:hypothetical protein